MRSQIRRATGATLFALAAVITATSASAAIVTGRWDPALPEPPFNDLGWTATINLKISDDCTSGAQSLPFIVNVFGRSFGCKSNAFLATDPFSILSAQIGLYDLNTNVIVDVLTFSASSFTPFLLDLDPNGDITYLLSLTDSNAVQSDIPGTTSLLYDFKLALPGSAPAVKYRASGATGNFTTAPGVPTETDFAINDNSQQADVLERTALREGQVVFSAVPEPGSLALVALALGAAGFSASRRPRRAA
jgi:hypothetical protein